MRDQISFAGFKEFVKSKTGTYDYYDEQNCAMGQYLQSFGYVQPFVGHGSAILDSTKYEDYHSRAIALGETHIGMDPNILYYSQMFPELVSGENKEGEFMWNLRAGDWERLAQRLDKMTF